MRPFVSFGCPALAVCAVLLVSGSPQEPGEAPVPTAREQADRAIAARAVFQQYCHECHGGKESKGTVAVLNHASLVAGGPNPVPFVSPGQPAKSQIIQLIEDGSMPPGGRQRPSRAEIESLKKWIEDGAPPFPASFDVDATLKLVLDDAAAHPEDAPHTRYLSFTHLIRDGAVPPDLAAAERDLFAALRDCGLTQMPTPVDAVGTLYRLDLRQAGWDSRELFLKVSVDAEGIYPLTPHDLLLLEYPFAERVPSSHPLAKQLGQYLATAKLSQPVPVLRADWVTGVLKKQSPLVADLKSLGELHAALPKAAEARMPCGPRPRAFGQSNPVPAVVKPESPAALLPLSSWYAGDCAPAQPPFSLAAEVVDLAEKPAKSVKTGERFRLRVTSDRKAHFALVAVWSTGHAEVEATTANGFLEARENLLRPEGGEDGFSVSSILTSEKTATEYFVLLASPDPLPKLAIVRSRHSHGPACEKEGRYPVYRFLFQPDPKFDPTKVVRKVIPVTVTTAKGD